MRRVSMCVLLLAAMAGSAVADGPETGLVSGVVTDASGAPLPGVSVTITGDRGEKATVTEEDGTYRFALLVPGSYIVKAELEGMGTADETVQVTAGQRSDVDLTLKLETAETITVTSEAPMVDKFNVTAGATMHERGRRRGHRREPHLLRRLNFMPGVTNEDENPDLSSTRPNVNGATWADSTVYIDGVDTTFSRYGGTRVFLPSTATTEVSLESGGLGADYGRTVGSATNVIVKSGTNNFHGDRRLQPHRGGVELRVRGPARDLEQRESNPQPARLPQAHRRGEGEQRRRSTRPRSAARSSATRPGSSSRPTSRTPTTPARPSTATSSTRAATSSRASRRSTSSPRPSTRWR